MVDIIFSNSVFYLYNKNTKKKHIDKLVALDSTELHSYYHNTDSDITDNYSIIPPISGLIRYLKSHNDTTWVVLARPTNFNIKLSFNISQPQLDDVKGLILLVINNKNCVVKRLNNYICFDINVPPSSTDTFINLIGFFAKQNITSHKTAYISDGFLQGVEVENNEYPHVVLSLLNMMMYVN